MIDLCFTWNRCRDVNGIAGWPDGGAYLDQPLTLIRAWEIIAAEVDKLNQKG